MEFHMNRNSANMAPRAQKVIVFINHKSFSGIVVLSAASCYFCDTFVLNQAGPIYTWIVLLHSFLHEFISIS